MSLLHDRRFQRIPMSEADTGDIIIESAGHQAEGYAGIVVNHGRIVSDGSQGVCNNSSLAEVHSSSQTMAVFRYIGARRYPSRHLANAGYDPNEPRLPAGQTGGGQWTDTDGVSGGSLLAAMRSELKPNTLLLVHFLDTGQQQMMTLAEIARAAKSSRLAIEVHGKVMIDVDGSGPDHGDADQQPDTSYHSKGAPLNAETTSCAVAPRIMSWDSGKGLSILRGGDRVTITANGKTIEAIVGDFGPNKPKSAGNTTFGEISYKAVRALNIPISHPSSNPATNDYPVTIVYYLGGKTSARRDLNP